MKYGYKKIPFTESFADLQLKLIENGKSYAYHRLCRGVEHEKLLLMKNDEILLAPVEPLNKPSQEASYLMVEFGREIMLEPGMRETIFLTFPIEIGMFVGKKEKPELVDIFTLINPRYTLYGEPRNGFICRWWKSLVHLEEPKTDHLYQGVIRLVINNSSRDWVFVNKALFNGLGMKIYYNDRCVSMKAQMKVLEEEAAEIEFQNSPLYRDMKKSPEIFTLKRLSVTSKKAVMLEGI